MRAYEIIEHTADIGVKAWGHSREELFAHMAEGMFSLLVSPEGIRDRKTLRVQAQAGDEEGLLVAWLRELLYLFDTQRFLGKTFQLKFQEPHRVKASVSGEELDETRHPLGREVKAVTYCDLAVKREPDGTWSAQVIFDI